MPRPLMPINVTGLSSLTAKTSVTVPLPHTMRPFESGFKALRGAVNSSNNAGRLCSSITYSFLCVAV